MWARDLFDRLRGGQTLAHADPWLELVHRNGPTPVEGPLRHDWLLPSMRDPSQLGINVFARDTPGRVRRQLLQTVRACGWDAAPFDASSALRFHGGVVWRDGQLTVKAYATGPVEALDELGDRLKLMVDDDVLAVGFDVSEAGVGRARLYRPAHALDHTRYWARYPAWAALDPLGLSHRLVASLEPPHTANEKRSFDHFFAPSAPLQALAELATDVHALEPLAKPSFDAMTLKAWADVPRAHGLVLRPVSYEVDIFADGRRQTDALATVGTAQ